jgi:hypothetical protein
MSAPVKARPEVAATVVPTELETRMAVLALSPSGSVATIAWLPGAVPDGIETDVEKEPFPSDVVVPSVTGVL